MTNQTLAQVPLSQLVPSDDNLRFELTELEGLALSIKEQGLLTPLLVTTNGVDGYKIVAGHRRLAAMKLLGDDYTDLVPVVIQEQMTDAARISAMLVENLQRVDIDPIEEAFGYQRLVEEFGVPQREIGVKVGRNQSHVSRRLALLNLSEEMQALLRAGKITVDDAQEIAKLDSAERQNALIDGNTVVTWKITSALNRQKSDRLVEKMLTKAEKAGIELTDADAAANMQYVTSWSTPEAVKGADLDGLGIEVVVLATDYSGNPVFKGLRKAGSNSVSTPADTEARKVEREKRKIERQARAERERLIEHAIVKATKAEVGDLAMKFVVERGLYHSIAPTIGRALSLEPLMAEQHGRDDKGNPTTKNVADWVGTVNAWAGIDDKSFRQVVTAIVLTTGGADTVRDFLDAKGIPSEATLAAAIVALANEAPPE